MNTIDSDGLMKVEIGGEVHRRPAQLTERVRDFGREPAFNRATPMLHPGEVLIETIGSDIPMIVRSGL